MSSNSVLFTSITITGFPAAALAVVAVIKGVCQGCFMNVPPQVVNLIKMYDNLVICEVCQRILYIEDELR